MRVFARPQFFSELSMRSPGVQPSYVERHGRLKVQGTLLVDQHGRTVVLRGMSLFWSQWAPRFFNLAAIRWLLDDWKITVIRAPLAVHHGGYLEYPDREQQKIESVIEAAISLGIYVIVDWHSHEPEPKQAALFFKSIAEKYGRFPNVIYEIWNEPSDQFCWRPDIRSYHNHVIAKIRAIDPLSLIVAGTQNWCRDVDIAANDPLPHDNVLYSLHFYAGSHREELRTKAELALRMNAPLIVTEWGGCHANGDGELDIAETHRWWRFLEKNSISYINWSISDRLESSAALLSDASSNGGWTSVSLSRSGNLARSQLRKLNS